MLDMKHIKDATKAYLETVPGTTWYHDQVPEGKQVPTTPSGKIKPYGVMYWAEPFRAANGRGIVSTRHDTNICILTAQVNAPDADTANAVIDQVRDKLAGWSTTDTGEFYLRGGAAYSRASTSVAPTTYVREINVEFYCNTIADYPTPTPTS